MIATASTPSVRAFFLRDQITERAVAALGIEAHRDAIGARARGIAGEDAGDDAPVAIELGSGPMDTADPRGRAAAEHRKPQRPTKLFAHRRHQMLLAGWNQGFSARLDGEPRCRPARDHFSRWPRSIP
jgi:hypothetical protein